MNCPNHFEQYNELALAAYQTDALIRSAMKQIEGLSNVGSQEIFDIDTLMQIASERLESTAEIASGYSNAAMKAEGGPLHSAPLMERGKTTQ